MRLKGVDLNLLLAFDALMRERHVTRAAERLDISQSSMSLALARLRTLFQDPILVKSGSGLAPTLRALELLAEVEPVLESIDRIVVPQREFDPHAARETVNLIVTDYIDFVIMPTLVATLATRAPGMTIRILGPNPKRLAEVMSTGQVDLALTYFPNPPESLRSRGLFADRLVCIARKGHPVLGRALTPQEFAALGHITIEPGEAIWYNALVDDGLAALGLQRRVVFSKPTFLGVPFIVEKTDLVSALPQRVAQRFTQICDVEIFEAPLDLSGFDVVMLWHDRTHNNAAHRWFRDMVIEACGAI